MQVVKFGDAIKLAEWQDFLGPLGPRNNLFRLLKEERPVEHEAGSAPAQTPNVRESHTDWDEANAKLYDPLLMSVSRTASAAVRQHEERNVEAGNGKQACLALKSKYQEKFKALAMNSHHDLMRVNRLEQDPDQVVLKVKHIATQQEELNKPISETRKQTRSDHGQIDRRLKKTSCGH